MKITTVCLRLASKLHLGRSRWQISVGEKHSMLMNSVLTVRADGLKLPILFIMKGQPGRHIESSEFPTFPEDHHYAMQENAWMDRRVWAQYLRDVLGTNLEEPSVVLMDNFEAHEQILGNDDDPFSLTARQKRKAMVNRAISAWDMVSGDVIRQSFVKALPESVPA
ncbi:hypothetical protein B5M09_008578 [Aphanomyces astaci]|uniref:DDE-1 domain-containing protein n=1 Tax=Aphanomyces astaci TaxID=112090 RepID=A0A3R7WQG6_APHAT|nr:hypothetical protein B5M09_008578 [Aphanomyces astaci]